MDKINKYYKTIPSIYAPKNNNIINGMLKAWAESDEDIVTQIEEVKKQLFVETAQGDGLNSLGSNVGVDKPIFTSLSDPTFRDLIISTSYLPKQVRKTMYEVLDVFWGPLFSRANITSTSNGTYDFGGVVGLTGTTTFENGSATVEGSGTLFLTEVSIGDYVRLTADDNTAFAKVSKIIDNENLVLSKLYDGTSDTGAAKQYTSKKLNVNIDNDVEDTVIDMNPVYFVDTLNVTAQEISTLINENYDRITAQIITSIFTLDNFVNIRTNTPGLVGSIHITGGDANTELNFITTEQTINSLEQSTVIYETNHRELVIKVPQLVAKLERTLKGAAHLKHQYSGDVIGINNVDKEIIVNLDAPVFENQLAGTIFAQNLEEFEITGNTAGQEGVVLYFNPGFDLSLVDGVAGNDRSLKGSIHIHRNILGDILAVDNTLKTVTANLPNSVDTNDLIGVKLISIKDLLDEHVITGNTSGQLNVTLQFGPIEDLSGLIVGATPFTLSPSNTTFNVNHNLDFKYNNVTVYDSSNKYVIPDIVTAIDSNNLQIDFSIADTGNVFISHEVVINVPISSSTWNINHALGSKYVNVTVYDSNDEIVIPNKITAVDSDNLQIEFGTNQTGNVAVSIDDVFNQVAPNTTWTITHNLNNQYVNFTVYDSSDEVIVPDTATAVDANTLVLTFSTPQSGNVAVGNPAGFLMIDPGYPNSFVYHTASTYTVSSDRTVLNQNITASSNPTTINVVDGSAIPNSPGYLIFEFGFDEQEQPVPYTGVIGNVIQLDGSYVFAKSHLSGTMINKLAATSFIVPNTDGSDYAVYITGDEDIVNSFIIIDRNFPSPYVYDTQNPYSLTKLRGEILLDISAGRIYPVIGVLDASDIPNEEGFLIFGFGTMNEEQPVKYIGRPTNETLLLDPTYTFEKNHSSGEIVNVLDTLEPYKPRNKGEDYAAYITGTDEALDEVEEILRKLKAVNVILRMIVDRPIPPFTC